MKILRPVLLCLVFFVCACLSFAQTETATITGQVTDATKARIPNARIVVTNTSTNVQSVGATDSAGAYVIPGLIPGPYRVEVEKQGFKSIVEMGLILHVQDTVQLNYELAVGAMTESVTVDGSEININTTDATVSTVMDRQFAENLPMNGRSFQTLIELTPGVVLATSILDEPGQFSVNGQRISSNYWMVDGVSANIGTSPYVAPGTTLSGTLGSFSALGGTKSLVSVDALQEFRIQTSTFAPEFGRTPGAQISIVTRSGTNQFHGALFDYFRNDVLDANDWFADSVGLAKPRERQNDFGGTLGGPILKNKTFFFFSYEGLRLRLPQTSLTYVPDLAARQNAVPAMQPYLNAYPMPNGLEVSTILGAAQFNKSFSNPGILDAYSLRIDHKVDEKLSIFGRYNYSPTELDQRGFSGTALSNVWPARITTQTGTAGFTWSISPAVITDFWFNYSSTDSLSSILSDNFGGAVPLVSLPFPSGLSKADAQFGLAISSLGFTDGENLDVGKNANNSQRQINIVDTVSMQKSSHALKFGVDFRRLSPHFGIFQYAQSVSFLGVDQAETGTSSGVGLISNRAATILFRNLSVFVQDTWHVSPLTRSIDFTNCLTCLSLRVNPPSHRRLWEEPRAIYFRDPLRN